MKQIIATIALVFAVFATATIMSADGLVAQDAQPEKSEPSGEWILVKPPLKDGKYTFRVEKFVKEGVGCESEDCGCWQTGAGCGAGEICVGVGICVPESSGIRGGRDVPTYMMP